MSASNLPPFLFCCHVSSENPKLQSSPPCPFLLLFVFVKEKAADFGFVTSHRSQKVGDTNLKHIINSKKLDEWSLDSLTLYYFGTWSPLYFQTVPPGQHSWCWTEVVVWRWKKRTRERRSNPAYSTTSTHLTNHCIKRSFSFRKIGSWPLLYQLWRFFMAVRN